MIPDKIYLPKEELEERKPWIETTYDPNWDECYIRKDALIEWINAQQEKLWELLPDADNDNPTQMELRYLGQYMQLEAMEDKVNEM